MAEIQKEHIIMLKTSVDLKQIHLILIHQVREVLELV